MRVEGHTILHIQNICISNICVFTSWFEERRPLALVQVTWGGGFPGAKQLSSRLWPSWTSAIDGWMLTTDDEIWSAAQTQTYAPYYVFPV